MASACSLNALDQHPSQARLDLSDNATWRANLYHNISTRQALDELTSLLLAGANRTSRPNGPKSAFGT
jgi:hypothetical protein